jgi:hypothetical protein
MQLCCNLGPRQGVVTAEKYHKKGMKKIILLTAFALLLPVIGFVPCNPCAGTLAYFDVSGMQLSNWIVSRTQFSDGNYRRPTQEGGSRIVC